MDGLFTIKKLNGKGHPIDFPPNAGIESHNYLEKRAILHSDLSKEGILIIPYMASIW